MGGGGASTLFDKKNVGISSKTSDKIRNVGLHRTMPKEILDTIG